MRLRLCLGACVALLVSACGDDAPSINANAQPLDAARAQLQRGDGVDAEAILRAMLSDGSSQADLAAFLGEAALLQGDLAKARRWLGKGEFSSETAGYGFQLLGRLELREGNLPASGIAFDNALKSTPDAASLWVDIGRLRYRGGEHLQAIEAADYAMELDNKDPDVLHFKAQLTRDAAGKVPSLALFEQALKARPEDLSLLTDYAATLGEVGRVGEALEVIRRTAKIAPKAPRIHYLQSVIAARAGKLDLARTLLLAAPAEEQELPAAQLLASVLDMEAANFASAAQNLDRLYKRQPDNRIVRHLLMRALFQSGAERELIARFGDEAMEPRTSAYYKTLIARAYEVLDEREKAAELLDAAAVPSALTLVPLPSSIPADSFAVNSKTDGRGTRDLVRAYLRPGRTSEAVERARNFAAEFPGSGDAFSLLGDARLAGGDEAGALDAYRNAAKIRRTWPLTLRQMAAHVSANDQLLADEVLRDFLASGARSAQAANLYARVLAQRGDWAKAAQMLDAAMAQGGVRAPDLLALRSVAAARLDKKDEAREFAWAAYRLNPFYPPAILALKQVSNDEAVVARMDEKLNALQRSAR